MAQHPNNMSLNVEELSALMDGEVDQGRADAIIDALCRDTELQRRWSDLQLVGDALRSSEVAVCQHDGFCARVHRALLDEPAILAPRRARPSWRRYLAPGAAIAASAAAITFMALPLLRAPEPAVMAQGAGAQTVSPTVQSSAVPPAATPSETVAAGTGSSIAAAAIANARALDPYYAAHRELTGGTPLPRAAAYLRTHDGER